VAAGGSTHHKTARKELNREAAECKAASVSTGASLCNCSPRPGFCPTCPSAEAVKTTGGTTGQTDEETVIKCNAPSPQHLYSSRDRETALLSQPTSSGGPTTGRARARAKPGAGAAVSWH